jgi:pimeloyl-ACP methyl ester carboxylesterase
VKESIHVFERAGRRIGIVAVGSPPRRRAGLVFANSGIVHRIGANRMSVVLARGLAADGYDSLRFDMSGLGDSSERRDGLSWETAAPLELVEAVDLMVETDRERPVVMYGNCGGAAKSVWAAMADDRINGLVLTNPPPHPAETEHGSSEAADAAAAAVADDFDALLGRGVRIELIFAADDPGEAYFERRLSSPLAHYIADGSLHVVRVPHSNHTFSPAPARRAVISHIRGWLTENFREATR